MANVPEKISDLCISASAQVREALEVLERSHKEIVLVVESDGRLSGTVTDGDVRRAILHGLDLSVAVEKVMCGDPVTGQKGMRQREMVSLMNEKHVLQLPILSGEGAVVDLVLMTEILQNTRLGSKAVIMAGGSGTRMRPLTYEIPKPLLPVADKPILEIIIEQLVDAGVDTVYVSTHYKADMIEKHFSKLDYPGADVRFIREDEPMGTAGSIRMLEDELREPFLMLNADSLTRLSFAALLNKHIESGADLTIAVKRQELQIAYGVVETDADGRITSFAEKPVLPFNFNIGIYAVNPRIIQQLPASGPLDVNEVISLLLNERFNVREYPVNDYWIDIGQPRDYERACNDMSENPI